MGCHFFLQGIFPTQGSNLRSPALQAVALPSEPPGKPSTINYSKPINGIQPNLGHSVSID